MGTRWPRNKNINILQPHSKPVKVCHDGWVGCLGLLSTAKSQKGRQQTCDNRDRPPSDQRPANRKGKESAETSKTAIQRAMIGNSQPRGAPGRRGKREGGEHRPMRLPVAAPVHHFDRQTRQTPVSYRDSAPTRGWTSLPISTQNLI
ncbi:hypothetical protein JMJ78_0007247 [Colletotrichum scovillei]|nr:hypothetical protein JMJ78_0007247 [Colletotrichum scovillei]